MKNERILITGAGGMVGSRMVEIFYNNKYDFLGTYFKPTVDISELPVSLTMLDVTDKEAVNKIISNYKPTIIFHLAAQSFPTVSWKEPIETMTVNVNGTINIFEAVKNNSLNTMVVVACSSAEYGAAISDKDFETGISEDTPLLPLHTYGVSKVAQDLISYQYYKNFGIKCIRARIFNTTGIRKTGDCSSDFIRRIVDIERKNINTLKVGNLNTIRAIMDVDDLINALCLLAKHGIPGEAYNISSETKYSIKDIIELLKKITGQNYILKKDINLLRPADEKFYFGSNNKLKKDTNWKQSITLEETLTKMLEYWRKK